MGGLEVFNRTYIHIHPAIYFETEKFLWTFNRPGEYYAWVPFNTKLRARVKITPREERHLFSRGGEFHARTLFAPSTIPEEKWRLLEVWHELNYNIFVKLGRASTTIAFSSVSHVLFCDRKDSLEFQQIKTLLSIAPSKGIRISESGKILFVESGILGFGIQNTTQGIRNPINYWNPESKFH